MISSRDQRRIYLLPARPPDAPTIPIGAAHISFLGQHRISQAMSKTRPRVSSRGPRRQLGSDQHLEKHWPGGAKIKMAFKRATPKGKVGGGEGNGKTKVGPCWRSFIQSELSRGPDRSPLYLLFQTLLPLFWTLTCMI